MLRNDLVVALRALRRSRGYAVINVVGLALGLACCLLIYAYVAHEYRFDAFHANGDALYRVTQTTVRDGGAPETQAMTAYALGPALAETTPEVVRYARVHPEYGGAVVADAARPERAFEDDRGLYVDPAFLQMFSFPLDAGDGRLAPGTAVVTHSAARRYFGDADPLGRTLHITGWISGDFRVTGVLRDPPSTSHLQFSLLLPMEDLLQRSSYLEPDTGNDWSWSNFFTYVQLRPGADLAAVGARFTDVLLAHRGDVFRETHREVRLVPQPLRDVHLNPDVFAPELGAPQGSYRSVHFFALIGAITLLIALINYVNLATARALDRAREVGMRKAVGAQRGQLLVQFLVESALTNTLALALALALAAGARPLLSALTGVPLPAELWAGPGFWAGFLGAFAVTTVLAGLYPALVLSAFRPVAVLKGGATRASGASLWLRRGLVVVQFAASVVLVAGMATAYDQLRYARSLDLGLDLDQVLTLPAPRVLPDGVDETAATRTLSEELRRLPAVQGLATSSALPGQGFTWYTSGVRLAEADPSTNVEGVVAYIDSSFATLYGMELVAGQGFESIPAETPEGTPLPVLVTETTARALGLGTPAAAVDEALSLGNREARIVGVLRDFSWSSAHVARENVLFGPTPAGDAVSLRVRTAALPQTLAAVERIYTALFPGNPFSYAFADATFDAQYRADQQFATLFALFAGLAVLIACLGLFGLAAYTTQQRRKEIGVRKVLGATVPRLVGLLLRDVLALVGVAAFLAVPVAHALMQRWLEGFAYRIALGPGVFAFAAGTALLMALIAVSAQTLRAATADPVQALHSE